MPLGNPTTPSRPPGPPRFQTAGLCLAILGATLAAYLPAMRGGLQWDDAAHITAPSLRAWHGLWRIWFQVGTTQQYYPVLHSAFWLEHRLWGDSVLGYHLANVALHAAAACLFALTLARIRPGSGGRPRRNGSEWLAAAVFALHPVCVESVAWISEQKNTLSLVFYLLAALAYLRFDRDRRWKWYALALGLFLLALLSKSVTATLPAALLLVLAWGRRLSLRRDVLPLAPWFVVGAAAGLFTAWVERNYIGARGQAFDLGLVERFLLAGRIVWFYLGKLLWPSDLTFIYPRWSVGYGWTWSLGLIGLAATLAALYGLRGRSRGPLVAFLFYVGSLFPALGFFNVYPFIFSYVADHWQYLPCLGMIALMSGGAAGVSRRLAQPAAGPPRDWVPRAFAGLAAGVLALLFTLTWRQCGLYRSEAALYSDTLAKNPGCWMAHNNLGAFLTDSGSPNEAIVHLRQAVRLKPDYSDAHNNLGNALSQVPGGQGEAISEFVTALSLEPGMVEAHANLGWILANTPGRLGEGITHLQTALRGKGDDPDYAALHSKLGLALARSPGGLPSALAELDAAVRLDPEGTYERDSLGVVLAGAGRPLEAVAQFEWIVRRHPENAAAHNGLGNVLLQLGRGTEAVGEYRTALRLDPKLVDTHVNLGRALRNVGGGTEAIREYQEALRLEPDSAPVRNSLGTLFFRLARNREALAEYEEAVRIQPDSAPFRNNLGIALTAEARLDEAIAQFREALRLAPGFADAHYNLGVALQREGRSGEAAAEYDASGRARP